MTVVKAFSTKFVSAVCVTHKVLAEKLCLTVNATPTRNTPKNTPKLKRLQKFTPPTIQKTPQDAIKSTTRQTSETTPKARRLQKTKNFTTPTRRRSPVVSMRSCAVNLR